MHDKFDSILPEGKLLIYCTSIQINFKVDLGIDADDIHMKNRSVGKTFDIMGKGLREKAARIYTDNNNASAHLVGL
jgi:hypothetical protein